MRLTDWGRLEGQALVRSHRLWEIYLMRKMALAPDHVHPTAMRLEHFTDAAMRDELAKEGDGHTPDGAPLADPHGRAVP